MILFAISICDNAWALATICTNVHTYADMNEHLWKHANMCEHVTTYAQICDHVWQQSARTLLKCFKTREHVRAYVKCMSMCETCFNICEKLKYGRTCWNKQLVRESDEQMSTYVSMSRNMWNTFQSVQSVQTMRERWNLCETSKCVNTRQCEHVWPYANKYDRRNGLKVEA